MSDTMPNKEARAAFFSDIRKQIDNLEQDETTKHVYIVGVRTAEAEKSDSVLVDVVGNGAPFDSWEDIALACAHYVGYVAGTILAQRQTNENSVSKNTIN